MLDSFNYMNHYLPIRRISWDGENLGVLLYEGYMGVELSHRTILRYFIHKVRKKVEVNPQILAYVSRTILLGLEGKISSNEILRGKGNKAKKKTRLPAELSSFIPALKGQGDDLKAIYDKMPQYHMLVGYTSSDNIERIYRKERERSRRLRTVERLLDEIVDIHNRLCNEEPVDFIGGSYITSQDDKLQEIYKKPNRLW